MKTDRKNLLNWILWPILKIIWEPLSVKKSHWWHWRDHSIIINKLISYPELVLKIPGDKEAGQVNSLWSKFYQRNFGWQKIALLFVYDKQGQIAKNFRIGFSSGNKCEVCSIMLQHGTGVFIGPNDVTFFALDSQDNFLKVVFHAYTRREHLKHSQIGKSWSDVI